MHLFKRVDVLMCINKFSIIFYENSIFVQINKLHIQFNHESIFNIFQYFLSFLQANYRFRIDRKFNLYLRYIK